MPSTLRDNPTLDFDGDTSLLQTVDGLPTAHPLCPTTLIPPELDPVDPLPLVRRNGIHSASKVKVLGRLGLRIKI